MFSQQQLASIDRSYFEVILADPYDVTIRSKNTGHVWCLHNIGFPADDSLLLYHKHHISHPYHTQRREHHFRSAIKTIKSHDDYQINVRNKTE